LMTSNGNVPSTRPTLGPVPSAITAALETNISLQAELKRRLLKIRCAQVQNRRDAAKVVASISWCWNNDCGPECGSKEGGDRHPSPSNGDDAMRKNDAGSKSLVTVVPEFFKSPKSKWARKDRKGFRGFFTDPDGSSPNTLWNDIGRGNDTENEPLAQMAQAIFEKKKKSRSQKQPQKAWADTKRKNQPTASFEEVSLSIESTSATSAEDCHTTSFTFADSSISKAKFTKQESLFILSLMSKMGGDDVQRGNSDWYEIAEKVYAKFKRGHTPWQCFCHYRSTLQNPSLRPLPWSPDEDELILKYVALHGPQYLLQGESLVQMCRNMFPVRNIRKVAERANLSLINPNYVSDSWSTDEKRKLALLMRVYSDEHNSIHFAARRSHFSERAPKSVFEKWKKSLDPALSHRPFTHDEDVELQENSGQVTSAVEREKFPKRTNQSLKRRWAELADERTVAIDAESRLIRKALSKRNGPYSRGGDDFEEDSVLSAEDLVVLPQSKVARRSNVTITKTK